MAIATKFFFWATIIYTALEALGVTKALADNFQKLTDALGFTDKASRDTAEANRLLAGQLAATAEKAQAASEALKKYNDAAGNLTPAALNSFTAGLKGDDRDSYIEKYKELIKVLDDYNTKLKAQQAEQASISDPKAKDTVNAAIAQQQAAMDAAQKELDRRKVNFGPGADQGDEGSKRAIAAAQAEVDAQGKIMADLQTKLGNLSQANVDSLNGQIDKTKSAITSLQGVLAATLTPESEGIVDTYFQKLVDAQAAAAKAKEASDAAIQNLKTLNDSKDVTPEQIATATDASNEATKSLGQANRTVLEIKQSIIDAIAELKKSGGLVPAAVGSLDMLQTAIGSVDSTIATILNNVNEAKAKGLKPTGTQAAPPINAASGTGRVDATTASEEKRRRQAELAITKAGLEAQANLQKEYNSQINDANEDAYKHNIKSIKDYYAERLRLQKANLDIEINLAKQNLGALGTEMSAARGKDDEQNKTAAIQKANPPKDGSSAVQPADGSEVMRIQAQVVQAQGQIKLLELQKSNLDVENQRALRDAQEEFTKSVASQKASLVEFLSTGDAQAAFDSSLAQSTASYKDFVDRLKAEAKEMPSLLPIIDQIETEKQLKAAAAAIEAIGSKADIATGYLDITASRIQALGAAGVLTNAQVSGLEEANRAQIIATKEAQNAADQERLDNLVAVQGAAAATTLEYQKMQLAIAQRSGEIANLKVQGNTVATDLNKSLHSSIQQGLIELTDPTKSFGDAIVDFFTSVVNSLRDKAAEGIADTVMQAIGSTGSSGWGGFWSDLLGSSSKTVGNSGTGANALAASTSVANTSNLLNGTASATGTGDLLASVGLGSTAATPLYVTDAATALA
ncbi:hypothetical protein, partial [Aquabacterium sp.]|uniref:hypothetical protein n=1 Tax=Aquabacterium sp. TaxID=1872578 RepID=UPI0025B7C2A0